MIERYRLKQDGTVVAGVEGPTALDDIIHYARVYGQDGPVTIERHENGKWREYARRHPA
jgi:hypothetical protein